LANFISNLLKTIVKVFISCNLVTSLRFKPYLFDFNTARTVFSFGLWNLLSRAGKKIRLAADPILLNLFTTPMDVSIFYIGALFSDHFSTIITLLIGPFQPPLIAMYAKKEFQRMEILFYRLNKYLMWLGLFFITPIIFFRKQIIVLYIGDSFVEAAKVMGLLFLPSLVNLSLRFVWILAPAMGQIKNLSIMTFVSQILNLLLTIILLKYFHLGATGSALATCIVGFAVILFMLPHSLHLINGRFSRWAKQTFIPGILPCCICFLFFFCLDRYTSLDSLRSVIISGVFGCVFYFITALLCTTATDRSEISLIVQTVLKKISPAK